MFAESEGIALKWLYRCIRFTCVIYSSSTAMFNNHCKQLGCAQFISSAHDRPLCLAWIKKNRADRKTCMSAH